MLRQIYQIYSYTQLKYLCEKWCSAHIRLKIWKPPNHCAMTIQRQFSSSTPSTNPSSSPSVRYVEQMLGNLEMERATETLYEGVIGRDRASLARAITLVESSNVLKRRQAQLLLTSVLQHMKGEDAKSSGGLQSFRIGKAQSLVGSRK